MANVAIRSALSGLVPLLSCVPLAVKYSKMFYFDKTKGTKQASLITDAVILGPYKDMPTVLIILVTKPDILKQICSFKKI